MVLQGLFPQPTKQPRNTSGLSAINFTSIFTNNPEQLPCFHYL